MVDARSVFECSRPIASSISSLSGKISRSRMAFDVQCSPGRVSTTSFGSAPVLAIPRSGDQGVRRVRITSAWRFRAIAAPMRYRAWLAVALPPVLVSGCYVGPSEEQLRCYQACGRSNDHCMLHATTAQQIQACDQRSSQCSAVCE